MNKKISEITFVKIRHPDKELVTYLYRNFSFGEHSLLCYYSKIYCKANSKNKLRLKFDIVIALYRNKVVGWGLATGNLARTRKRDNYKDIFTSNSSLIMLYINQYYRGLGIASRIFADLMKLCPSQHIIVIGHDKISWKFFSKFKKIYNRRITITDWR